MKARTVVEREPRGIFLFFYAHRRLLGRRRCLFQQGNKKAPKDGEVFQGQIVVGVRRALLPLPAVRRLAFAGRGLPDATLRGRRMFRSHGGTVPAVPNRNLLSEASSPSSEASCRKPAAGRGTGTPARVTLAPAPLPRRRHRLLADRWLRVTGLTSGLSGCLHFCSGVTRFVGPPQVRRLTNFAGFARFPWSCRLYASRSLGTDLLAGVSCRTT